MPLRLDFVTPLNLIRYKYNEGPQSFIQHPLFTFDYRIWTHHVITSLLNYSPKYKVLPHLNQVQNRHKIRYTKSSAFKSQRTNEKDRHRNIPEIVNICK